MVNAMVVREQEHGACCEPGSLLDCTGEAQVGAAVEAVMYDE